MSESASDQDEAATTLPLRRVDMRGEYDCGVACIAMLTGLDPEAIEDRLGYKANDEMAPGFPFGVLGEEAVILLHEAGRHPLHLRTQEDIAAESEHFLPGSLHAITSARAARRWLLPSHESLLAEIAGRHAMLAVKKTGLPYGHSVVWDRDKVLDPATSRVVEREGLGVWRIQSAIIALVDP